MSLCVTCITVYHCVSLCVTVCHSVSLFTTVCPWVSLSVTVYHCVSLGVTVYHCVSLCTTVHCTLTVPLCTVQHCSVPLHLDPVRSPHHPYEPWILWKQTTARNKSFSNVCPKYVHNKSMWGQPYLYLCCVSIL